MECSVTRLPDNMPPISQLNLFLAKQFEAVGIKTASLDARLLLQYVSGLTHSEIIAKPAYVLSPEEIETLTNLFQRRLKREPLSRLIGKTEFWSLPFEISPDTLDPRPDTETLIEHSLQLIGSKKNTPLRLLDLGTGTGCILLSLLHELPEASGLGVDLNPGALEIARKNALNLSLDTRAEFQQSDWFSTIDGKFDAILSNPPYIPESDLPHLMPEVRDFDPILALNGGETGLAPYEIIFKNAINYLKQDGMLIFEFGQNQEKQLIDLLNKSPLGCFIETLEQRSDLAGIVRTIGVKFRF